MGVTLAQIAGTFAVARLAPTEGWPWWATQSASFASVTRTEHETSVVCEASFVPQTVTAERGFALFAVDGPIDFAAVGVLAGLTAVLASSAISVLAVCSYDTDHLLVREGDAEAARAAWRAAGHHVRDSVAR